MRGCSQTIIRNESIISDENASFTAKLYVTALARYISGYLRARSCLRVFVLARVLCARVNTLISNGWEHGTRELR